MCLVESLESTKSVPMQARWRKVSLCHFVACLRSGTMSLTQSEFRANPMNKAIVLPLFTVTIATGDSTTH